ncbi:hypothetical protein HPB49_013641 [Dermacentor silvarum]|uniref:Uncharacterized protein n=1 Tax=Dermacentor silvarum TaxID=543639 RepID=A0ACB8E0P4_DERSI|nr:hypothetical protein HPB49_013641 [Dermacentor silvarum]
MPSIRYKEPSPEIEKLREKEKGDWKNLSLEEKKALYRYSFFQTYAEMNASRNEWKPIVGNVCLLLGCTLWIWIFLKKFVYGPMPQSTTLEAKQAQLQRMIDLRFVSRHFEHIISGELVRLERSRPLLQPDAILTIFPNVPMYLSKPVPKKIPKYLRNPKERLDPVCASTEKIVNRRGLARHIG